MAASNILAIPFRKSTHLSLATAIRQYINTKYDQHPDMFRQDLDVIDALRRDAVNVREAHPSGIKKLQAYAAQLVWIGGKFPLDIGAEFTWYPALGYNTERPLVRNNLKYELLNVLYNLAALYSQLAMATSRGAADGHKTAVNYFNQAAGVLSHMQKEVLPELRMSDPPEDMDEATLEALMQLCLSESQECFWQKAVTDGYKDAIIAKLAARVSDLYNNAGEAAMNSQAISSAWIHHMSAKHHHFAAAAQYRAACDCLEKRRYGEEVARLQDALACVNEGLKESKGGYLTKAVVDDLNGLKRRVEEDLKRAEKDNDVIYLNPVPPKSELKVLDRANMAVAKVPPQVATPLDYLGDQLEFGPALFAKLVPFSVHIATSIYEERRDRLVNQNIIQELETLTERIHQTLSSLNLPGSLQALEKPLGLPHSLVQRAEEIRQADAIGRIQRSFADVDKLRDADVAIFEEGRAILATEEEEDNRLRAKYGTDRWTRPGSRQSTQGESLWKQATDIEGYFATSTSSDAVVREKYNAVQEMLSLLAGSDRVLMDFVPSSRRTEIPETLKPAIGRLRSAYNDVLRLESRRRKKVEALREKCRTDDIKPDILKEAARLERTYPNTPVQAAHFEDFFEKRLDRVYDPELDALDKDREEQDRVMNELERANREFEAQKRGMGDRGNREREKALQELDNAYYKYKDIINNVEAGRKFYNDLSKVVGAMRDNARAWANERRLQARQLEDELAMPPLSSLSLGNTRSPPAPGFAPQPTPPGQPVPAFFQPVPSQGPGPANSIQSWAGAGAGVEQPRPIPPMQGGVWTPELGIRFGNSPAPPQGGGNMNQQGGQWEPGSGIRFG